MQWKSKCIYNAWQTAVDGKGSQSFGMSFSRNILIFGVDNSSSFFTDNNKNLVLGDRPTDSIHESASTAENMIVLTLPKKIKHFHYNGD